MTIQELEAGVRALTNPNDVEQIVAAIKFVRERQQVTAASAFVTGDRVKFHAKGKWIVGTVEKINTKSLALKNCTYLHYGTTAPSYRVAPTLCVKV